MSAECFIIEPIYLPAQCCLFAMTEVFCLLFNAVATNLITSLVSWHVVNVTGEFKRMLFWRVFNFIIDIKILSSQSSVIEYTSVSVLLTLHLALCDVLRFWFYVQFNSVLYLENSGRQLKICCQGVDRRQWRLIRPTFHKIVIVLCLCHLDRCAKTI